MTTTTQSPAGDASSPEVSAVPTVGQRAYRQRAVKIRTRVADPAGAASRIATYVPDAPGAADHMDMVRSLATAAGPVDAADASELLSVLAGHAAWLDATGQDVTATTLLDAERVQRWILIGLAALSAGTTANYRSRLTRVAAVVNGHPGPVAAPLYASDPTSPYRRTEVDAMLVWAAGQRTERFGRDLRMLLTLGLGAGLSTAELLDARATDLAVKPEQAVTVTVRGLRPRVVHVDPRHAPVLLGDAGDTPDGHLLLSGRTGPVGKNGLSNLVDQALRTGTPDRRVPRPVPQRMRATWLVAHLAAGTRVDVLLAQAGLDSLAALDRYLPFVPQAVSEATAKGLS